MRGMLVSCVLFAVACCNGLHPPPSEERVEVDRILRSTVALQVLTLDNDSVSVSVGSGFIAAHARNLTYIVTAGHVCGALAASIFVRDVYGGEYHATPVYMHPTADVCVVVAAGKKGRVAQIASSAPYLGARVTYAGAPKGVFDVGAAVISDGRYSGVTMFADTHVGVLSGITTGGSSGSGVHFEGKIIGIVVAVAAPASTPVFLVPAKTVKEALRASLFQ